MSGDDLLAIRDLTVLLGGRHRWLRAPVAPLRAVDGVSLGLRNGEVLGLVGESGCGKTTLGRTLLGLQREAGGEIRLRGRRVSGLAPAPARVARREIQYVHQDAGAALDPWWSVGHTLEEALRIQGLRSGTERRARVRMMLPAVGLDASAYARYPHELSGGQLRRISLARILLLEPRIVILDEPTAGLDMSVQATVLNLLLELRRRLGLTYLFISHDLSVVQRLCDRVAIMYAGRIIELADARAIFEQPRHPYTRALLAAAPRLDGIQPSVRLRGEPPRATAGAAGCAFAPRCAHADAACRMQDQVLHAATADHEVACRRWQELAIPAADIACRA